MTQAFVGLGANLGDPPKQIHRALDHLRSHTDLTLLAISPLYRSAPLGPAGQPDYCNAVAQIETALDARASLQALLEIEQAMGRLRGGERWGPRSIDLDLLLFGNAEIDEPGLSLPHPEMHKRNFVMRPLVEIAPQLQIPGQGNAAQIAEKLGDAGLQIWEHRS